MNFSDVAIVYVKGSAYRILFWYISKDDAISIINNSNLIDKKGVCNFFIKYNSVECSSIEETYYQKDKDVIKKSEKIITKMIKKD